MSSAKNFYMDRLISCELTGILVWGKIMMNSVFKICFKACKYTVFLSNCVQNT